LGEEEDLPPIYPGYSRPVSSDDHSVASGNNSVQWEEEAECVLAAHYDRAVEEEARADMELNDIPVIAEFELAGAEMSGEGNEVQQAYENVVFTFRTTTAKMLVEVAKEMGLQYTGAKKDLWERILKF
jgi:hypothetical protein